MDVLGSTIKVLNGDNNGVYNACSCVGNCNNHKKK